MLTGHVACLAGVHMAPLHILRPLFNCCRRYWACSLCVSNHLEATLTEEKLLCAPEELDGWISD